MAAEIKCRQKIVRLAPLDEGEKFARCACRLVEQVGAGKIFVSDFS
jgi:hypothetical protein